MREILFRGISEVTDEWVYGYLVKTRIKGNEYFSIVPYDDLAKTLAEKRWFQVIPETVGQFTGLTDKNGKKIFEGDIVKAECDLYHGENKKERVTHIGTVIYDKKFCQFGINVAGFSKCYVLNRWKGDYNEVIGNIHDNPELLKGGAE